MPRLQEAGYTHSYRAGFFSQPIFGIDSTQRLGLFFELGQLLFGPDAAELLKPTDIIEIILWFYTERRLQDFFYRLVDAQTLLFGLGLNQFDQRFVNSMDGDGFHFRFICIHYMVHIAVHLCTNLVQLFESVKRIDLIYLPLKTGSQPTATVMMNFLTDHVSIRSFPFFIAAGARAAIAPILNYQ
jgi:hypothetical protein